MTPRAFVVAVLLSASGALGSAALAAAPVPVSPSGQVERACPTFSWSAVPGAPGYELVVFEVLPGSGDLGEEPVLAVRLPAGAAVWTPPATECLAPGGRYAWALRVVDRDPGQGWSEEALFEVTAAPAAAEVETAIAALRRRLAGARSASGGPGGPRPPVTGGGFGDDVGAPGTPGAAGTASATPAAVPGLGTPSLTVDSGIALGAASNAFKEGTVFLWDDTTGNTALGRHGLASAGGTATNNTAAGWEALRYTVAGATATEGSRDTALGFRALKANTTGAANTAIGSGALYTNTAGSDNTAAGSRALFSNTTGSANTAHGGYGLYANTEGSRNTSCGDITLDANTIGSDNTAHGPFALAGNTTGPRNTALGISALENNTTGQGNVAVGYGAGFSADAAGTNNVLLLNSGTLTDTATIRIGTQGTQAGTFVAGVQGTTTSIDDAVTVVVDSAGQLGTVSSSRAVKQDVRDVGELSRRLLELRPVAFRYRAHAARDSEAPVQYGLVAEEVAEVFPELVAHDAAGRPWTVKYRLLPPLLLHEMQRLHRDLDQRRTELDALRERVEAAGGPPPRAVPWWRRLLGSFRGAAD